MGECTCGPFPTENKGGKKHHQNAPPRKKCTKKEILSDLEWGGVIEFEGVGELFDEHRSKL